MSFSGLTSVRWGTDFTSSNGGSDDFEADTNQSLHSFLPPKQMEGLAGLIKTIHMISTNIE